MGINVHPVDFFTLSGQSVLKSRLMSMKVSCRGTRRHMNATAKVIVTVDQMVKKMYIKLLN